MDHTALKFRLEDASFPIFYAVSCSFLVFDHLCWTIALWDGLHKRINRLTPMWWPQIIVVILSHFLNTLLVRTFCQCFPWFLKKIEILLVVDFLDKLVIEKLVNLKLFIKIRALLKFIIERFFSELFAERPLVFGHRSTTTSIGRQLCVLSCAHQEPHFCFYVRLRRRRWFLSVGERKNIIIIIGKRSLIV